MQPSRRSSVVTLTLLGLPVGAIMLANAFPGHDVKRNYYADRAACERDYSPQQCAPNNSGAGGGSTGGSSSGGGYYGPWYSANRSAGAAQSDPGPGRTGREVARTEISTRGGFGAFGRAMRAVG